MRFVTVAVDQHDVAWGQQGLLDDLVGRGSSVRDKEDVVCSKGPRGLLLSGLDSPRRLKQTVQTTRSCGRFREKKVQSIELAHVPDPIRFKDGFASCDRQGVERAHRPLRIFL